MERLKKCTSITSNLNSIVQWKDYKVTIFNKKAYLTRLRRETSRLIAGCFPSFIWHQPSHMKHIEQCTDVMSNCSEYNDKLQGNSIQVEMSLIVEPQVIFRITPEVDLPLSGTHLHYETNKVMYQCCE